MLPRYILYQILSYFLTSPKPPYVEPVRRKSQEELIAQRTAIGAAYEKPTIPAVGERKRFVYDPDKLPVNKNYEDEKQYTVLMF
jgi:hypothetical protein